MIIGGIIIWAIGFIVVAGLFGYASPGGASPPETLCGIAICTIWPIFLLFLIGAILGEKLR